jgi:hypothetical protein
MEQRQRLMLSGYSSASCVRVAFEGELLGMSAFGCSVT